MHRDEAVQREHVVKDAKVMLKQAHVVPPQLKVAFRYPGGKLPLAEVQRYGLEICKAVAELHDQNIISQVQNLSCCVHMSDLTWAIAGPEASQLLDRKACRIDLAFPLNQHLQTISITVSWRTLGYRE